MKENKDISFLIGLSHIGYKLITELTTRADISTVYKPSSQTIKIYNQK